MIDFHYFAGGLTDTPEIRFTPKGHGVATFTLAQSDNRKNDQDEWETTANAYLRVTMWDTDRIKWTDALAGLAKGTKLVVAGKLITNKWQDKDGNNRSQLECRGLHAYQSLAQYEPQGGAQQSPQPTGWTVQDKNAGFGGGSGNNTSGDPAPTGTAKDDTPPF